MDFKQLDKTPIGQAFSSFGKRIFLPQGIFYWAGIAKERAKINGTIGSAKGSEIKDLVGADSGKRITLYVKGMEKSLSPKMDPSTVASYAPIGGLESLRDAWKKWIVRKEGLEGKEHLLSTPAVTCGLTNGLYFGVHFFLDEGETVLLSSKHWGNYDTIFYLNMGIKVDNFNTFKDSEFDTEAMVEKIKGQVAKQGKAVVLLNFPNNPSGYSPSPAKMEEIAKALGETAAKVGKPVIVLCDDAYEGYVYDEGADEKSLFPYLVDREPMLIPVKIDGVSKELLFYGGRVGFITFGLHSKWDVDRGALVEEIDSKITGAIRSTFSNASHVSQRIVLDMMEDLEGTLAKRREVIDLLGKRWKAFKAVEGKLVDEKKGIYTDPVQGGFFAFLNLPLSIPATEFAMELVEKHKIGVIPISKPEIGVNGIRIGYCSMTEAEIEEAAAEIATLIASKN